MRILRRRYGHTVSSRGLKILRDTQGFTLPESLVFDVDRPEVEQLLLKGFLKVQKTTHDGTRILVITRKGRDEVAGPLGLGQPTRFR